MSYHYTILRTNKEKIIPIRAEEVIDLVSSRDDLVINNKTSKKLLISNVMEPFSDLLLVWQNGQIWSDSSSDNLLPLMLLIANELDARVRGDDLETYKNPKETYLHPDDKQYRECKEKLAQELIAKYRTNTILYFIILFSVCFFIGYLMR